jgi:1-acyl-sn-glycerol-3-phosphate acyltransferase
LVEDELKTSTATRIQQTFRTLVAWSFYAAATARYDVVVYGREHVSAHHPKIVLSNHKRDLDSVVLAALAFLAQGFTKPNHRLVYALREDAFWPDFLDFYLHWRSSLRVAGVLRLLKCYPMGYVRSRSDLPRIESQLRTFAWLLDHGRDVYWTPEGGLSVDGRLGRFRAGFHRLVRGSRVPLRILPVAIFYDFTTTGRTRCSIRFGPELAVDRSLGKSALEEQARTAILRQTTINAGHLAAAALRDPGAHADFTGSALNAALVEHARRLAGAGLPLDPRLRSRRGFARRVDGLLAYLVREGVLAQSNDLLRPARGLNHPGMRYVLNELQEAESAVRLTPN